MFLKDQREVYFQQGLLTGWRNNGEDLYRPTSLRPSCLRAAADRLHQLITALWGKELEDEGHWDSATVSQNITSMLFSVVSFESSTWKRHLIMIILKTHEPQTPKQVLLAMCTLKFQEWQQHLKTGVNSITYTEQISFHKVAMVTLATFW